MGAVYTQLTSHRDLGFAVGVGSRRVIDRSHNPCSARRIHKHPSVKMQRVRVGIVRYRDRRDLAMRYRCPVTRKQVQRTTGTADLDEATTVASQWERELNEGGYRPEVDLDWFTFCEDFSQHYLSTVAEPTASLYRDSLAAFGHSCRPRSLASITPQHVEFFGRFLRAEGLRGQQLDRRVEYLLRALRWAQKEGLLRHVPEPEALAT